MNPPATQLLSRTQETALTRLRISVPDTTIGSPQCPSRWVVMNPLLGEPGMSNDPTATQPPCGPQDRALMDESVLVGSGLGAGIACPQVPPRSLTRNAWSLLVRSR
jgi:hypothetical protein